LQDRSLAEGDTMSILDREVTQEMVTKEFVIAFERADAERRALIIQRRLTQQRQEEDRNGEIFRREQERSALPVDFIALKKLIETREYVEDRFARKLRAAKTLDDVELLGNAIELASPQRDRARELANKISRHPRTVGIVFAIHLMDYRIGEFPEGGQAVIARLISGFPVVARRRTAAHRKKGAKQAVKKHPHSQYIDDELVDLDNADTSAAPRTAVKRFCEDYKSELQNEHLWGALVADLKNRSINTPHLVTVRNAIATMHMGVQSVA
jgi:hypothetical protein